MLATATIDEFVAIYLSIYLSCVCFHCLSCFSYSIVTCVCLFPQSFININNVETSSIESIINTSFNKSFPPNATGTPQQLQSECKPAMAIVKYRPIYSYDPSSQEHSQTKHKLQQLSKQTPALNSVYNRRLHQQHVICHIHPSQPDVQAI